MVVDVGKQVMCASRHEQRCIKRTMAFLEELAAWHSTKRKPDRKPVDTLGA